MPECRFWGQTLRTWGQAGLYPQDVENCRVQSTYLGKAQE